jgi:hypothetical protein
MSPGKYLENAILHACGLVISLWKRRDTRLIAESVSGSRFESICVRTSANVLVLQFIHKQETTHHSETLPLRFCSSRPQLKVQLERSHLLVVSVETCVLVRTLQCDYPATLPGKSYFCCLAIRRWLCVHVESDWRRPRSYQRHPVLYSALCRLPHREDG